METRFGVLAVPETQGVHIENAAKALQDHFGDDVAVGIGAGQKLVLYLLTKRKLHVPSMWHGFQVNVKPVNVKPAAERFSDKETKNE